MTNYKAGEAFQLQRVMKVYDGNNDVLQMSEAIILNNKVIVSCLICNGSILLHSFDLINFNLSQTI